LVPLFGRDKRKQYRVRAAHGEALRASVTLEDEAPLEAVVVDTSAGGCRLLLPPGDAARLPVGTRAGIEFVREGGATPRTVPFEVRNSGPDEATDGVLLGCAFLEVEDFLRSLNKDWWRFFNRRSALRVPREPVDPIVVRAVLEGYSGEPELENLSVGGACLRLRPDVLEPVRVGGKGRLMFDLPEGFGALRLAVRVRHATAWSGAGLVGLEFDAEGSPDFNAQEEQISRWFVHWQSRAARAGG
jgi:hypothetical protein